mmetsp:Transcript_18240/g.25632  ORF Transcript_18240/g.25632 Transcript_18240/m.25632 type:complete len:96 (+) Transcript_18240:55-342(+)|eukprot:CAMPEP_0175101594 /NCGR_PEP_ID=MMETSP0086_2-20121207/7907_1 /TAXON_ID=136419 /ORGANISM="Unknown Unknown, Strain D1" /LENGTH=95 /DNA_ID=CAMNT_0016376189 /DNA_START=37 /DNA_END=324 /DNA_ORIENTATION=+
MLTYAYSSWFRWYNQPPTEVSYVKSAKPFRNEESAKDEDKIGEEDTNTKQSNGFQDRESLDDLDDLLTLEQTPKTQLALSERTQGVHIVNGVVFV